MPRPHHAAAALAALLFASLPAVAAAQDACGVTRADAPGYAAAPYPLVLDADRVRYGVPLRFRAIPPLPPAPVTARAYDARSGVELGLDARIENHVALRAAGPRDGGGAAAPESAAAIEPAVPHLVLEGDAAALAPGGILVDLRRQDDASKIGTICIPVAAPPPGIRRVEIVQDGRTRDAKIVVAPNVATVARIRVFANRLLPGATLDMDGFEESDVRVEGNTLTATVRHDATGAFGLPLGPRRLRLGHVVGGEAAVDVQVRAASPPSIDDGQVVEVAGGRTTVTLVATGLAEGATVRVEPVEGSGYAFTPFYLHVRDGADPSEQVQLPPLPDDVVAARAIAMNPDGAADTAVVRLRRPPTPTLKIEPAEQVPVGERRSFAFRPLDPGVILDRSAAEDYVVRVAGTELDLVDPVVDPTRAALYAHATLPEDLAAVGAAAPVQVTLRGPGLRRALFGTLTIAPRAAVSPDSLALRPGEARVVVFDGAFLSGASLQSKAPVAVVDETWGERSGRVTLRVDPTAATGTVDTLDLARGGARIGRIIVTIAPWAGREDLVAAFRYASGDDSTWHRLRNAGTPTVAADAPLRFRLEPIAGLAAAQLVRARIEKAGAEIWRDSVHIRPGAGVEFAATFRPADELAPGDAFTLFLEGQGGAYARREFRVAYEGRFLGLADARPITGISTLQVPLTDGYDAGVFDGVVLGANLRFAPLSRLLGSDVIRFVVLGTASTPRSEDDDDAAADAGGHSIGWGGSIGVLLANTLYVTWGLDSGGDGPTRSYLSLGTGFALDALAGLVRQ
ncbi:MAG TPA: hypothetical protein VF212_05500 [Longimicrobiales bacterium]